VVPQCLTLVPPKNYLFCSFFNKVILSDKSDNIYSNVVEASNANGSVKASDRICCEDISLRTVSADQSNFTIIIENIIPNNTLEAT
jgi:hypothetical protein